MLCVGLRQVQPDVCSRTAQEEKWVISQKLLSGLSGSYRLATNINQDMCLCFSYKHRISPKTSWCSLASPKQFKKPWNMLMDLETNCFPSQSYWALVVHCSIAVLQCTAVWGIESSQDHLILPIKCELVQKGQKRSWCSSGAIAAHWSTADQLTDVWSYMQEKLRQLLKSLLEWKVYSTRQARMLSEAFSGLHYAFVLSNKMINGLRSKQIVRNISNIGLDVGQVPASRIQSSEAVRKQSLCYRGRWLLSEAGCQQASNKIGNHFEQ